MALAIGLFYFGKARIVVRGLNMNNDLGLVVEKRKKTSRNANKFVCISYLCRKKIENEK